MWEAGGSSSRKRTGGYAIYLRFYIYILPPMRGESRNQIESIINVIPFFQIQYAESQKDRKKASS